MAQDQATSTSAVTYYDVLKISPVASVIEVRRAYRELSKRYHPDTTKLPPSEALIQFQTLNEAYATLSNPERRSLYDLQLGYFRYSFITPLPDLRAPKSPSPKSAYLDSSDRPLSSGEIFALFILAITLIACLLLALIIAMLRTESFTKLV